MPKSARTRFYLPYRSQELIALVALLGVALACSIGGEDAAGVAGASAGTFNAVGGALAASGGAPLAGGASAAAGGVNASGGMNMSGGTGELGGANSSGGAMGIGGSAAAGGALAVAGASSAGGTLAPEGGAGGVAVSSAGGSSAGGAGVGGGATSTYAPCPAAPEVCRVMPMGDSITLGSGSKDPPGGGYRVPLFHLALVDGKNMTFVGTSGNGPAMVDGVPFPENHNGHSGYIIAPFGSRKGLTTLVDATLAKNEPHIVLLMIGTNDINADIELAQAPSKLGALLDQIAAGAPDALIVVAQVTPTHTLNDRVEAFNSAIPGLVSDRIAAGGRLTMVDMYGAFTANANYKSELMKDDLHPNNAGYDVMADVWYAEIRQYLH